MFSGIQRREVTKGTLGVSAIRKPIWLQSRNSSRPKWALRRGKKVPTFAGCNFNLINIDDFKNVTN